MRTKIVALVLAVGLLAACGDASKSAAPPPEAPTRRAAVPYQPAKPQEVRFDAPEREPTAWERVTAGIEADGTVPKEVALQAFALTIGPIPGVTVPEGKVTVESGSAALRWISSYIDEVTPEQRAAIETALKPTDAVSAKITNAIFGDTEYSCTIGNDAVSADGEGAAKYRPILNQELAKVEAALGQPLGIPVYLTLGTSTPGSETLAWASPQSAHCADTPATSCRVQLMADKMASAPAQRAHASAAHELVHCFQATWMPARDALRAPAWIAEGFADFVGQQLNPGGPRINLWLYVTAPHVPLFERDYEAQGFFFHLLSVGGDPYGRYSAAFKLRDSDRSFAYLIEPSETAFDDTWASVLTLEPERGDAWYMPEAPPDAYPYFAKKAIRNGSFIEITAEPAATRLGHLDFDADVVRFAVSNGAHGRVGWDGGDDSTMSSLSGATFCARGGGCECPPGTTGSPPKTRIPSEGAMVTAAGITEASHAQITGVSLDDYCKTADTCVIGTWTSGKWTLPGPASALTATGGAGAKVRISEDGAAEWDFDGMDPLAMHDPQIDLTTSIHTSGSATGHVTAADGVWTVEDTDLTGVKGATELSLGGSFPSDGAGAFVLLLDGTYTCDGDQLSYSTPQPTTGQTVSIVMSRE